MAWEDGGVNRVVPITGSVGYLAKPAVLSRHAALAARSSDSMARR